MLFLPFLFAGVSASAGLSDAVHGILLRHSDPHVLDSCNAFATDALASCGPGDLPCQCNQVSNVHSYCASLSSVEDTTLHPITREYLEVTCKNIEINPSTMTLIERILRDDVAHRASNGNDLKFVGSATTFKRATDKLPADVAEELGVNSFVDSHSSAIVPKQAVQEQLRPLIAKLRKMIADERAELNAKMKQAQEDEDAYENEIADSVRNGTTKEKRDYVIHRVNCCETEEERIALLQNVLEAAELLNANYPVIETTIIAEPASELNKTKTDANVHVDAPLKLAPGSAIALPEDHHVVLKGHVNFPLQVHALQATNKHKDASSNATTTFNATRTTSKHHKTHNKTRTKTKSYPTTFAPTNVTTSAANLAAAESKTTTSQKKRGHKSDGSHLSGPVRTLVTLAIVAACFSIF